jgi:hypothetical protein
MLADGEGVNRKSRLTHNAASESVVGSERRLGSISERRPPQEKSRQENYIIIAK